MHLLNIVTDKQIADFEYFMKDRLYTFRKDMQFKLKKRKQKSKEKILEEKKTLRKEREWKRIWKTMSKLSISEYKYLYKTEYKADTDGDVVRLCRQAKEMKFDLIKLITKVLVMFSQK